MLTIGDGINDINMLQKANVSVGIQAEKSKFASKIADFSIPEFRVLVPLVLDFGFFYYKNISMIIKNYFYKNYFFAFTQLTFAIFTRFSTYNLYPDFLLAWFNLFLTIFIYPLIYFREFKGFPRRGSLS